MNTSFAPRSLLFVPAHRPRMVEKALGLPADALVLELEDGVPAEEKPAARAAVARFLEAPPAASPRATLVRVNGPHHLEWFRADMEAIVRPGLHGVVLPKVESTGDVDVADAMLSDLAVARGLPAGGVRLLLIIESPIGLLRAYDLATRSPRTAALIFGGEDFALGLGLPLVREGEALDLLYPRSALVVAAAAAGLPAVDGVWAALDDAEGLAREARQGRRLGFAGKLAVHPSQLDAINQAFTPSPAEVTHAREVVRAYEEALAGGRSAVQLRGQFIDPPVVARAARIVAQAAQANV